jgi:hypothetical protein
LFPYFDFARPPSQITHGIALRLFRRRNLNFYETFKQSGRGLLHRILKGKTPAI